MGTGWALLRPSCRSKGRRRPVLLSIYTKFELLVCFQPDEYSLQVSFNEKYFPNNIFLWPSFSVLFYITFKVHAGLKLK